MASRRPVNPSRRVSESGTAPFSSSFHSRSRSPSYLSIALIILGALFVIGYFHRGQGTFGNHRALSRVEGDFSCTVEVEHTIPILKKAYGDSMHKVLHVGPDTCSVVSRLIREEDTEAFGVEPYDIEDADRGCRRLVHRGLVRVADIKFPLPYRAKSFSLVIVSDALDYLSPKYLNRTLPELARVSSDGLVIFTGYPRHHKAKAVDKAKYGRPAKLRSSTWWIRYFVQMSLEENEAIVKKFEQAAEKYHTAQAAKFFISSLTNDVQSMLAGEDRNSLYLDCEVTAVLHIISQRSLFKLAKEKLFKFIYLPIIRSFSFIEIDGKTGIER